MFQTTLLQADTSGRHSKYTTGSMVNWIPTAHGHTSIMNSQTLTTSLNILSIPSLQLSRVTPQVI